MTETVTPPNVAELIAARGFPITLATGETVRVVYTFAAIEQLERDFGSLTGIVAAIDDASTAFAAYEAQRVGRELTEREQQVVAAGTKADLFTVLLRALLPALGDASCTDPRNPSAGPVPVETHPDAVKRALDPGRIREYMDAVKGALSQAFGVDSSGGGAVPPAGAETAAPTPSSSPGPTGTTSHEQSSTSPMPSSGA